MFCCHCSFMFQAMPRLRTAIFSPSEAPGGDFLVGGVWVGGGILLIGIQGKLQQNKILNSEFLRAFWVGTNNSLMFQKKHNFEGFVFSTFPKWKNKLMGILVRIFTYMKTMKINHACRQIDQSHGLYGIVSNK